MISKNRNSLMKKKKKKEQQENYAKYKLFLDMPTGSDTELSYLFF